MDRSDHTLAVPDIHTYFRWIYWGTLKWHHVAKGYMPVIGNWQYMSSNLGKILHTIDLEKSYIKEPLPGYNNHDKRAS